MDKLTSSDVKEFADQLSSVQEKSFLDTIEIYRMKKGESLWRFISERKQSRFSDYWIDPPTMKAIMGIFTSWGDYSMNTKHEVIRDNLAILYPWSALEFRVRVTFKEDMIAYAGQTGPQKKFASTRRDRAAGNNTHFGMSGEKAIEFRVGGHKQFVIPRFKGISEKEAEKYAEVTYFEHI
jgi:hypothetical protein